MKQIRQSVFETNSSSVHSLAVRANHDSLWDVSRPLRGVFGEFGWGRETLSNPDEKLSYILTAIVYKALKWEEYENYSEKVVEKFKNNKYFKWLDSMMFETTGYSIDMEWNNKENWSPFGYIDHQSCEGMDVLGDLWSEDEETFKENMKQLVFNGKYRIIIDNDN